MFSREWNKNGWHMASTIPWYNMNIKITQYNILNVKSSNSQLYELKSAMKNGTKVTLNLSS